MKKVVASMKKSISLLLAVVLLLSLLTVSASAASDAVISKDTTLSQKFNVYNNLTLNPGVTLTTKMAGSEPQGIEMHGKLTVGAGAKIVGSGIILMYRGSSFEGMPFYYRFNGEYKEFPDIATAYERYQNAPDYVFQFSYQSAAGGWVWKEELKGGDPFGEPDADLDSREQMAVAYAETLKALGLMKGKGTKPDGNTDFALGDPLTRAQAVVMMVRLLGKEQEALNSDYTHPFTDVDAWAEKHIAYAYAHGITNGVKDTLFGSGQKASATMYITFILRAMGYNDNAAKGTVDFTYSGATEFAKKLGISLDDDQIRNFRRSHAAIASFWAVRGNCKDGRPLYERLIEEDVFTRQDYETVMAPYTYQ